jgi:hypothetical protein
MSDAPKTDWDLIYKWEWFRRTQWQSTFRAAKTAPNGGSCRAFADVARLVKAQVLLDSSCGLGLKTICLAEMGLNIVGCDGSPYAVEQARELAREEKSAVTYFPSRWKELPQNAPHRFDGIFNDALSWIPTWDELGASLVGLFHALKPGGFLMFLGAAQNASAEDGKRKLAEEWEKQPHEWAEWLCRDGAQTCARVVLKRRAADYIDDYILYVVDEAGRTHLESTTLRRPFYWNWKHWHDAVRMAGFCHVETRAYDGYAADGGKLLVNVAWRSRDGELKVDEQGRNAPYSE